MSFLLPKVELCEGLCKEPIRLAWLVANTLKTETAMKTANTILAGTAALVIISSAAFAQDAKPAAQQDSQTGMLTKIDRIHGVVTIQQDDKEKQSGTVGANTGGAGEEFKIQGGLSLEDVHAGDKVTYTTTGTSGTKTLTKIQKQKE